VLTSSAPLLPRYARLLQVRAAVQAPVNVVELRAARDEIKELIQSKYCNPILIRLGWHDAGTFDKVQDQVFCCCCCWWWWWQWWG
jgi:catalase (peroxidase I)